MSDIETLSAFPRTLPDALPCPFCGHGTIMIDRELRDGYQAYQDDPDAFSYTAICVGCACQGPWHKSATAAAAAWNRRVPTAPVKPTEESDDAATSLERDTAGDGGDVRSA